MAKQDIAAGRFRFLSICGYACELPGVGHMTYFRCYSGSANMETVDGTSDVMRSDRHLRPQNKALVLASEYNDLIARKLDDLGKRTCPIGEQWDALFLALSDHVKRVTAEHMGAWVSAFDDPESRGYDFRIHSRGKRLDLSRLRKQPTASRAGLESLPPQDPLNERSTRAMNAARTFGHSCRRHRGQLRIHASVRFAAGAEHKLIAMLLLSDVYREEPD
jgi:hypothetical protein